MNKECKELNIYLYHRETNDYKGKIEIFFDNDILCCIKDKCQYRIDKDNLLDFIDTLKEFLTTDEKEVK